MYRHPLHPHKTVTRQQFIAVARSWQGTPYRLGNAVKGAGADCASFIAGVLIECGLIEREDLGVYSHDWFCHTDQERYMLRVLRHAKKTIERVACGTLDFRLGSIILTRAVNSRVFNHGGIYTGTNQVVHAFDTQVEEVNITKHHLWAYQTLAAFDPFRPSHEAGKQEKL